MSPAKADATRRRLLDAATEDFAAHGVAGARVDRIAAAAGVNKAQLYAYFGDKLGLFDAVFRLHADAVADIVPFTATDLATYAVRLYDAFLARPDLVRLVTWAELEGIHTGSLAPGNPAVAAKLRALSEAQRDGKVITSLDPQDILALITSMALTWSAASPYTTATQDDRPEEHDRRRQALSAAVRRSFVGP
ncbi:TetR family transcriptional regulator [Streptomyces bluensis]|uniref:TetR family transcriptional regulator n=1 Tax=Streptomyces bluensis TaxID=33897 RepID=UPI001673825B|nr:TetR family transcriptional regulator [Streptomyces bluensis]GGZ40812.1 TetR family transcriptional regulator [Streptomyces bluensis]